MAVCLSVLLVVLSVVATETRPSPPRPHDVKVMDSLFGSHLSSLIQAPPPPPSPFHDITEGDAHAARQEVVVSTTTTSTNQDAAPRRFFRDFLLGHRKRYRGRSYGRKSVGVAGRGRGCFGMKMDRIGSMSGLGC